MNKYNVLPQELQTKVTVEDAIEINKLDLILICNDGKCIGYADEEE